MEDFLTKLRHATTEENCGIKLKKTKMYNIVVTFQFPETGNIQVTSSDRYFTNKNLAINFCKKMNDACRKHEKYNKGTYVTYDYAECELKIYDYFD